MPAFYLTLLTTFCLCCTALSDEGHSGVVRSDDGGAVTIKCRHPQKTAVDSLSLWKGPGVIRICFVHGKSGKITPGIEVDGRVKVTGTFPNMDIVISNLTSDDTGLYWCDYTNDSSAVKGKNTMEMLLVVRAPTHTCEQPNNNLILVSLSICGAVLLVLIAGFLIWIIPKTKMCTTKKRQRVPGNDVYEDMRATIRR